MSQKYVTIPMLFVTLFLLRVGPIHAQIPPTMEEAEAYFQAEEWAKAAEAFSALTEEDPANRQAWGRLGMALRQSEQYDRAIGVYLKIDAAGGPPIFKVYLGELYALTGHPDEAFAWLEKATAAGFANQQFLINSSALVALQNDERYRAVLAQADKNAHPCESSEMHRQFDFWVGEWNVVNAQGQQAGTNSIQKDEQGCVLVEHWQGSGGGTGMSINYYDPGKEKWVQQWVESGASVIYLEGGLNEDGAMFLDGTLTNSNGQGSRLRGTWTPLPDGRVRQFFESSSDDGATWTPWFDGYYARREP